MRTIHNPSPYQLSNAFRITRAQASDMLADDSGSTYERDVLGDWVTYDTATRTLTDHNPTRAVEAPTSKPVTYQPTLTDEGELSSPEYVVHAFGQVAYAPTQAPLANMFGSERVQALAPVSARVTARGTEWESELLGARSNVVAPAGEFAQLIQDWAADPVYAGVRMGADGFWHTRNSSDAGYARTGA